MHGKIFDIVRFMNAPAVIVAENPRPIVVEVKPPNRQKEQVSRHEAECFYGRGPNLLIGGELFCSKLDKLERRSGRVVGFYSIDCFVPAMGRRVRYSWRYGLWQHKVMLEKTYDVQVLGGR